VSSGIFSVILDQDNYLQGVVQTGGQLIGWEYIADGGDYCWSFRRSADQFYDADETAGALTIKGLAGNSAAAMIRWNNVPMTDAELNAIEKNEGQLLNDNLNPISGTAGNKQGERNLAWIVEAALPVNTGYQGAQAGVGRFYGFTGNQNELLIQYLQLKLGSTNPSIVGLQAETAIALGASSWNGVGIKLLEL
jgi:hypothetical protein